MDRCDSCGVDTKDYVRLKSYDWDRLAKVRAPLWKVVPCAKHQSYGDIIAVKLPMHEDHRSLLQCGCMTAWNTFAEDHLKNGNPR